MNAKACCIFAIGKRAMSGLAKKQHEIRKTGIGGSDVAAVLGVCQYRTPHDLWLEKTGRKQPEDLSGKPKIQLGIMLEPLLIKKYAKQNKCEIISIKQTLRHPTMPWLLASPDGIFLSENKILEIKTATFPGKLWGPSGSDIVPMQYILQVYHYMNVISAVKGCTINEADIYACIFGGKNEKEEDVFRTYNIKRDQEIIEHMICACDKFWNYNVEKDIPP